MTINRNTSKWLKPNRRLHLIEIICVVILLGIISAIGVHLMKAHPLRVAPMRSQRTL